MSIGIGYGKSNDWNKGTLVNLQNTNITTATAADGWLVLGASTPTESYPFDNLTGWTLYTGGTKEINPAGFYHSLSSGGQTALIFKGYSVQSKIACMALQKDVSLANYQPTTYRGGRLFNLSTTNKTLYPILHSNGTNYVIGARGDATSTMYSTDKPVDDSRWHLHGAYYSEDSTSGAISIDGIEYVVNPVIMTSSTPEWNVGTWTNADSIQTEFRLDFFMGWIGSISCYTTSGANWTSTYSDAIYNAGTGKQWKKLSWSSDTSNSTSLVVKVRCASTSAGLSSASYETVTSNSDFSSKGQWIQIECTFGTASSGRYTPVLKTIDITEENALPSKAGFGMGMGWF